MTVLILCNIYIYIYIHIKLWTAVTVLTRMNSMAWTSESIPRCKEQIFCERALKANIINGDWRHVGCDTMSTRPTTKCCNPEDLKHQQWHCWTSYLVLMVPPSPHALGWYLVERRDWAGRSTPRVETPLALVGHRHSAVAPPRIAIAC
jgi:RES domain-containing protein